MFFYRGMQRFSHYDLFKLCFVILDQLKICQYKSQFLVGRMFCRVVCSI